MRLFYAYYINKYLLICQKGCRPSGTKSQKAIDNPLRGAHLVYKYNQLINFSKIWIVNEWFEWNLVTDYICLIDSSQRIATGLNIFLALGFDSRGRRQHFWHVSKLIYVSYNRLNKGQSIDFDFYEMSLKSLE